MILSLYRGEAESVSAARLDCLGVQGGVLKLAEPFPGQFRCVFRFS